MTSSQIQRKPDQPSPFNHEGNFNKGRQSWTQRAEEITVAALVITVAAPIVTIAASTIAVVINTIITIIAIINDQDFLPQQAESKRVYKIE